MQIKNSNHSHALGQKKRHYKYGCTGIGNSVAEDAWGWERCLRQLIM